MNDYVQAALSGWTGAILLGTGLAMPYLFRRTPTVKTHYLKKLWPHYWLGFLAFFVSFGHSWLAMRSGDMRGMNTTGVWIATVALRSILWQIMVGLMLRNPTQSNRRALLRTHFWTMTMVAALIVTHIVLNRP